jgi:ligand-binding sensor domain-containing protein/signal transduction histidine kinase
MPDWKGKSIAYRTVWACALMLVFSNTGNSEHLPVKTYTTADGLAHNVVNRIVRDSRGFMWFCTFEGLSRFDGYGFMTYTMDHGLPSPVINSLLETRDGQYWLATAAGLCRFNPRGIPRRRPAGSSAETADAMFTIYTFSEDARSNSVTALLEDRSGVIWCGTERGLYRLQEQDGQVAFHRTELSTSSRPEGREPITTMLEDRGGRLWVSSAGRLYRLLPEGRVECYDARQGLPASDIHCLLEDREGRLWGGTRLGGLCLLVPDPDPARAVVARLYTEKDGLPTNWINYLLQASEGTIWVATNGGLIRLIPTADGRGLRFRTYSQPHGLTSQEVQTLAEDRSGNLWLGMSNGGAIKLARSGITAYMEADGFRSARAIFKDQAADLLVLGEPEQGKYTVNRFDGKRFTAIQFKLPKGSDYGWGWNQLILEDRAGEWWVASRQGLLRFPKAADFETLARQQPKAIYTTRDGLAGNVVLRLFEDSRGDIWIGVVGESSGLSRWQRATGTFQHFAATDGVPFPEYPTSFCEDRTGSVWIGYSFGGGLVRYSAGRFTRFTSADGLAEGGIFNLFLDSQGRLWIPTTRGGVCRVDHPEAERPEFRTYTTADGLASNNVGSVTEDRWGRIYIGNGRGIDRLDVATGHVRHYTTSEGVLLGRSEAALQDRDGALWFSCATGLMRLIPEPDQPPLAPLVLITGLRIAGDAQAISALGEIEIAPLELSANRNQLQVDFVALGFSPGEGLRYQYKLEGASEDWSPLAEQRTVNFANLAPGGYRFLVRSANADGVISETPASFSFTILPPFWQRGWFVALIALLTGLMAYAVYRYRLARLLELERVRTRIAADLHDDIGSSLSQIAVLSEVLRKQLGAPAAPVAKNLSLINRVSQEALDSMSDIVWAINPQQDHLSDLVRRMRHVASEMLPGRAIEFSFTAPTAEHDLKLGADIRRQVFLMFKEATNNIVRHSECRRAEIELKIEGGWLALTVTDDGKGFDPRRTSEGNGLANLRRRARALGGETQVSSGKGKGTTVAIRIAHRHHYRLPGGDSKSASNGSPV